jgi:phosphoesterase RecJ-like protein
LRLFYAAYLRNFYSVSVAPKEYCYYHAPEADADAMGSALGLCHFLRQLGHTVQVISPTNWARWLNWMEGVNEVLDFEMHKAKAEEKLDSADWLFCLDFNHFDRTKSLAPKLASLACTKILIDHHREPDLAAFHYGISNS